MIKTSTGINEFSHRQESLSVSPLKSYNFPPKDSKFFKEKAPASAGAQFERSSNLETETDLEIDIQQCYNGTEEHPEYTRNHVLKKKKKRSIKIDLIQAGFPPEIVTKADEIYSQMYIGSKRGVKKRQVMFFCAENAYKLMGIPEDPSHIAEKCGITRAEISKAYSLCAQSKTTFKAPLVHFGPKNYIQTFYQKMINLGILLHNDAFLKAMHTICDEALAKDHTLKEEKPHTVAAAVILLFLNMNNLNLEKSKFNEFFGFSEVTLIKIRNKIEIAYSS